MNVFISYGDRRDQITALRLQALAAVNGLTVYVPPANTRENHQTSLDAATRQRIADANVVLGIASYSLSAACHQELNTGLAMSKDMIIMASAHVRLQLEPHFGRYLVVMDPANADQSEISIVRYLKDLQTQQNVKNTLLALGTLALGLILLAPAESD
jgi:hypothetical protein